MDTMVGNIASDIRQGREVGKQASKMHANKPNDRQASKKQPRVAPHHHHTHHEAPALLAGLEAASADGPAQDDFAAIRPMGKVPQPAAEHAHQAGGVQQASLHTWRPMGKNRDWVA